MSAGHDAGLLVDALGRMPRRHRRRMLARIALAASTLDGTARSGPVAQFEVLVSAVAAGDRSAIWLIMAVLGAVLPSSDDVVQFTRVARLDGPRAALTPLVAYRVSSILWDPGYSREVRVAVGATLVDIDHTAGVQFSTGIQRVVRETVARWMARQDVTLVAWTDDRSALRALASDESAAIRTTRASRARARRRTVVIVPWRSRYLLPELNVEERSLARVDALARFSGNATGAIVYDCSPITSSETASEGISARFASYLAALRHMDALAAISRSAAGEFQGWRTMISSTGIAGPRIASVPLPIEGRPVTDGESEAVGGLVPDDGLPLLLCVGSHEPRKNHLAVLHAAELLWRRGLRFRLLFIGGNGWKGERFSLRLDELIAAGRPVSSAAAVPDDALWGTYRHAAAVLFPSVNEGYGLPVAEAIAAGTPVVTSDFGSMREAAPLGGAIFVDPRDDISIATAMAAILDDTALILRLRGEAARTPQRSWDDYSEATWRELTR